MRNVLTRKILLTASAIIIPALVLLWCWHPSYANTPTNRSAIYVAVFQKMMARRQRLYTGLSVGNKDPTTLVMRQFAKNKGVFPQSRIKMRGGSFTDKMTGGIAEIFRVYPETLKFHGPSMASIDAGAHGSGKDGYEGTYSLVCVEGHWSVTGYLKKSIMF
ncbi:MAG: hypothetical protein ABIY70_07940 [Capsulimonas sp.]|uniref:hypothetical protein n=1 Tax=Capsulimonas sp. TaxID=2494211 RepID=UPI00326391CF